MAPKPFNEAQRLEALKTYCALETGPNDYFDRLTKLACVHFDVPVSLVSLVYSERQWFKSRQGLDAEETPREVAFCAHAILTSEPLVVADATQDPRFASNPLVTGEPAIRFYAGTPLITSAGFRLGTLCLVDYVPRYGFGEAECKALKDFGALAMFGLDADRQRQTLSGLREEEAAAAAAQFDALATVAHEIRTPLSAIVSMANIMESETFGPLGDEHYQDYSSRISSLGQFMTRLSGKVLDLARLRSGEVAIDEETLDLEELAREAIEMVSAQAAKRSIEIEVRSATFLCPVRADRTHLLQMIVNLLSNAIRFSERGGRIILVSRRHGDGTLDLTVLDEGAGMSPEELTRALIPFGQAANERPESDSDSGIGLGLPLVQRLVELHGGDLLIESSKHVGTAATLRFPAFRVVAAAA